MAHSDFEAVIGLEIHCQLLTESKVFSDASTRYGADPNTQVSEVDLGLPGVLPILNRTAVEYAIRAGLALECSIQSWSQFARKNYFYPDLPKGYQISQHLYPLCLGGHLDIDLDEGQKRIGITRIHMEEDAGKSQHVAGFPYSLVDLNRAGVPLIEIVSEPDMRTADEAVAYMKAIHTLVVYLGICDGNMEEGSFRCDANVSVRRRGAEKLGTRAELKNINSFKYVKDAINFEIQRQIELVSAGGEVIQETRLYDAQQGVTFAMRSKEESHDYRYFPEPDLPPLVVEAEWLESIRQDLPELPHQKRQRYVSELDLSPYDASVMASDRKVAEYFETGLAHYGQNPKILANWVINELLREIKGDATVESISVRPEHLADLVRLMDEEVISSKIAKTVFEDMLETGEEPEVVVERRGLRQITDPDEIGAIVDDIIEASPENVQSYREGKTKLIGWFVGQVMQKTRGKANPSVVNSVLSEKLDQGEGA